MDKSNKFHDDVAEDTIADFVKEASAETAFLLDLLNQGSNCKMNKIIRECLESWSVAENLVETLPAPVSVVKCWIKVIFKISFMSLAQFSYFPNLIVTLFPERM